MEASHFERRIERRLNIMRARVQARIMFKGVIFSWRIRSRLFKGLLDHENRTSGVSVIERARVIMSMSRTVCLFMAMMLCSIPVRHSIKNTMFHNIIILRE